MEMDKAQRAVFVEFLKKIRQHQEEQKSWGKRPWSMNYIGIPLNHLHPQIEGETKEFSVKRTYAVAYKLREMGLVKFRRYRYMSKVMYLTDKGVEYVKLLKARK